MLSQMKKPKLSEIDVSGIGRRNDTVEAIRAERAMSLARKETTALVRAARPQAAPMDPSARALVYGDRRTPKQVRRMERKADRWLRLGLGVSGPALWDPEQCVCATMNNPPCAHCETAVYEA